MLTETPFSIGRISAIRWPLAPIPIHHAEVRTGASRRGRSGMQPARADEKSLSCLPYSSFPVTAPERFSAISRQKVQLGLMVSSAPSVVITKKATATDAAFGDSVVEC